MSVAGLTHNGQFAVLAIDHRDYITDHSVTLPNSDPAPHDPRSIRGPEDISVALFG